MFDPEFVKYLSTLGIGGVLAGFMFFFYRKDTLETRDTLTDIIKDNTLASREHTASNVRLMTLIEAMHTEILRKWDPHA